MIVELVWLKWVEGRPPGLLEWASRVPSGTGVLAFRTVEAASFLVVVIPSQDSNVGRFGIGFFGVL